MTRTTCNSAEYERLRARCARLAAVVRATLAVRESNTVTLECLAATHLNFGRGKTVLGRRCMPPSPPWSRRTQPMTDPYPVAIIEDRYNGAYAGGTWLAIANCQEPVAPHGMARVLFCITEGPHDGDGEAEAFWADPPPWIAVGVTPDQALAALTEKCGA